MKLLTKYSRINLLTSVLILLLASVAYYYSLQYFMVQQLDDDLGVEQNEIITYIKDNQQLPKPVNSEDEITTYKKALILQKSLVTTEFKKYVIDKENFRILRFYINVNSENYEVEVAKSLENTERIIRLVILITIITIIVLMFASFVVNRIVLRRLWKPFNDTIKKVKDYRLGQTDIPSFENSNINEFKILNETLRESISRNRTDYNNLQSFTENASHEMQTPVAIIHSKIDSLIQDENLSASQSAIVQEAYTALQRLIRLNKTLLLLTKIENNQYAATEKVNFEVIINEKILHFQDLLEKKNLAISFLHDSSPTIVMNSGLADIMLNNLLNNCIKYTIPDGVIEIFLFADGLEFRNGPSSTPLDGDLIFNRFYKSGNLPDQHGLGLAIVKEICKASNFRIEYFFKQEKHTMKIFFDQLS